MCGLSGYILLSKKAKATPEILKEMNAKIAHRGPDADGFYFDNQVGLAHRRLSIIDVSAGQQPMHSQDNRYVVVFNGEIYNYLSVNKTLEKRGYQFQTHSDTETILNAYDAWGKECLEHLNGMFAFAIWDKQEQVLFIARDRIGEKPLFYTIIDDTLFFASELKALKAHPSFDFDMCPKAIEDYMTFGYVPEPKTLYRHSNKLCSGHYFLVDSSTKEINPVEYWDVPHGDAEFEAPSDEETISRLKQVTDLRMMSEVPLGAFLSGGVDSSAVVAMMSQLQDEPVNSIAIGFDVPEVNESEFADIVAKRYQTNHTLEVVDHESFEIVDRLAEMYDEPFADSSALPTFKVCEAARKKVTVCLSGDGGDELFVGYRRYRLHANESKVREKLPLWLRRVIFKPLAFLYPKLDWAPRFLRAKTTFQSLALSHSEAYLNSISKIRLDERKSLYSSSFKQKLGDYCSVQVFKDLVNGKSFSDPIKEAQYLDLKTWMPGDILTKVDRASMANSLEVRVPMLDHTFIEWAFALPTTFSLKGKNGKAGLKKALEPHLSEDNLYREKMGFSIPLAEWLREPLYQKLQSALNEPDFVNQALFDVQKIDILLANHKKGNHDHSDALWSLFMLSNVICSDAKLKASRA
ncbi:XrtA/PEP-CTERM system amidotransferase [Glaciecola sp. KUL10]|uniref:XrtA/PEP-CTERM system amidotransferase n=1 Tax=Glaciecola sp. (strain KUL10) TaxID=2161813 RepID=UPI000D78224C|nr:XrtA/PEP-CTERM system amidotransferase [Glaciecola sp. KUL10]GBL04250.1 asparagine synthetase [Glaciecola sp. KUL10]